MGLERPARPRLGALFGALAALLACAALAAAPAHADSTIKVDTLADPGPGTCASGGSCSLREALERAEKGEVTGNVTIDIEAEGTLVLDGADDLEVEAGPEVGQIAIVGPGAAKLTITAEYETRVFYVANAEARIAGMTIARGDPSGSSPIFAGGAAVQVEAGSAVLDEVRMTENKVEGGGRDGGAVSVEGGGSAEIRNSRIDHNFSEESGGAVFLESADAVTIEGTEIDHNSTELGNGGGVAVAEGELHVRDSQISDNSAGNFGGGVQAGGNAVTVERSRLLRNKAVKGGGGINSWTGGLTIAGSTVSANESLEYGGGVNVEGPVTIEASTISGNAVPETETTGTPEEAGGGVAVSEGAPLTLVDSTVADNTGAGILDLAGTVTVHGSTIVGNTTKFLPGAGIEGDEFTVVSSILAGNDHASLPADCSGTVQSDGGNVLGFAASTPGCTWNSLGGDLFSADPMLGPLGDNGGPTQTMAPVSRESAAINHGGLPEPTDQRQLTRPVPEGPFFTDAGAVEVQAPVNLTAPEVQPTLEVEVGETLACFHGEWDTDTVADPAYSFVWVTGEEVLGSGGEYTLTNADAGKPIRCKALADNGAVAVGALSNTVEMEPAEAHLEPASVDFGPRKVGSGPSAAQTLTLTNAGSADLEVDEIWDDPTQFPIDASACLAEPLAPHQSCQIEARFAPLAAGAQSTTVVVESNVADATAELEGTGTQPAFSAEPSSFDFGSQLVGGGAGAAKAFAIKNTGDAPMAIGQLALVGLDAADFVLGPGDGCSNSTLEPGGECTAQARFAPAEAGTLEATIEVPGDAPGTIALSGSGARPVFSANPNPLDLGSVAVGKTGQGTVTVTNAGDWSMTVGTVAIEGGGGEFGIAADHCGGALLQPGEGCTVDVSFAPASAGARGATLKVPGDAPGSVTLEGTGTAPGFSVAPGSFDFGSRPVGGGPGTPQAFVVTNIGDAPMAIGQVALGGTDADQFQLGAVDTCSLATLEPGGECTVEASFAPTERWALEAKLEFPGDAPGFATLAGLGEEAEFSAAPSSLDFGLVRVGAAGEPQELTISNQGSAPMQIGTLNVEGVDTGSFSIGAEDCSGEVLVPAEECHVTVGFAPKGAGPLEASLHFPGDAPGSVALKGAGAAPSFSVAPGSFDFGSRPVGSGPGTPQAFVVTNTGTASMAIGLVALGGTDADQFQLAPGGTCSGATLAPGAQCSVAVSLAPSEPWNLEASLAFPGEAPGSVHLQGEGKPLPDPRAKLKLGKGAVRVGSSGKAKLRVTCASPSGAGCAVKLTLQRVGGAGGEVPVPKKLAGWRGKVKAGRTALVQVALTRSARDALASYRKLKALAILVTGGEEETRAHLTLAAG